MLTLSVRGLDEETGRLLKEAAQKAGKSVNAQVVEFVRRGLGVDDQPHGGKGYSDLDHLAGTWSEVDAREFEERTAPFEEVDEELWR